MMATSKPFHRQAESFVIRDTTGEAEARVATSLDQVLGLAHKLIDHSALIASADIGHSGGELGIANLFETVAQARLQPRKTETSLVTWGDGLGEVVNLRVTIGS